MEYDHSERERRLLKKEMGSRKKTRISIAIDREFLAWIDDFLWICNFYPA